MQLFNINSNLFQNTLLGEYKDYKSNLSKSRAYTDEVKDYSNGDILFTVNQNSQSLTNLLNGAWNVTGKQGNEVNFRDGNGWLSHITDSIIKVDKLHTFKEAITLIDELSSLMGDTLAGVLLVADKMIINPLHPLSALVLMDNYSTAVRFCNYKVIVYKYDDVEAVKADYGSDHADKEKITENVRNLISLYTMKQKINKTIKTIKTTSGGQPLSDIQRVYRESMPIDATEEGDFIIIPHTLITKGIAAPYYGTSVVIRGDVQSKGAFITPFQSANISSPVNNITHKPDFNSICTGKESQVTAKGLRTLNHANLSSPLNSYCIGDGAYEYAQECIKQSLNLYRLGNFIGEEEFAELEEELDAEALQFERLDAEEEKLLLADDEEFTDWVDTFLATEPPRTRTAHDDLTDTLTYAHLVDAQETLRGQHGRPAIGTRGVLDNITVGTTTTTGITYGTTTTGTTAQFITATDIQNERTMNYVEEAREEFGRQLHERADQLITQALTGEAVTEFTEERFFPAFENFRTNEADSEIEDVQPDNGEEPTPTEDI